jgi:hypothetical protein
MIKWINSTEKQMLRLQEGWSSCKKPWNRNILKVDHALMTYISTTITVYVRQTSHPPLGINLSRSHYSFVLVILDMYDHAILCEYTTNPLQPRSCRITNLYVMQPFSMPSNTLSKEYSSFSLLTYKRVYTSWTICAQAYILQYWTNHE